MREHLTVEQLFSALPHAVRHVAGKRTGTALPVNTVCCDSRRATSASIFVCIVGAQNDGHRYMKAAYLSGCRVFLTQTGSAYEPLPQDAAIFETEDTRTALAHLACAYYGHPARSMRIVGITGTKGKTTVAMMCYHILNSLGMSAGYIGTCGVRYGNVQKSTNNTTPDALELQQYLYEMKLAGVSTVFLEVSSQGLWQRRVDGISFDICALTNLYPDHIGYPEHPTIEHYTACKRRLMTDFGAPILIGNADDAATLCLLENGSGRIIRCGSAHDADLLSKDVHTERQGVIPYTVFTCHCKEGEPTRVRLPLPGDHNVQNALFALAIVRALGISEQQAAAALKDVRIPGRFDMLEVKEALVVIDYAHNGAALRAVLGTLKALTPSRLLCLCGSVGGRTQCRRAELGAAADALADFTYLTADDPNFEPVEDICRDMAAAFSPSFLPRYKIISDRAAAIREALGELSKGDILLIAGKGDETIQHIGGQALPHSDRAVVESYIGQAVLTV